MVTDTPSGLVASLNLYDTHEPSSKFLIHYSKEKRTGEFIVWIDQNEDLDWACDDAHDVFVETDGLREVVRSIENRVNFMEPSFANWPPDLKLAAKRRLGEALVSALYGDLKGAEFAIEKSQEFLKDKGKQVSRYWTLWSCLVTAGVMALVGLNEVIFRVRLSHWMGMTPYLLSLCFCAGAFGAGFFVLMKLGKQAPVDSSAERHLHWLEGVARILGGGLGGFLIGGLVRLGVVLPALQRQGMEPLAMCLAAMLAGASERLAAGIITRVENQGK